MNCYVLYKICFANNKNTNALVGKHYCINLYYEAILVKVKIYLSFIFNYNLTFINWKWLWLCSTIMFVVLGPLSLHMLSLFTVTCVLCVSVYLWKRKRIIICTLSCEQMKSFGLIPRYIPDGSFVYFQVQSFWEGTAQCFVNKYRSNYLNFAQKT